MVYTGGHNRVDVPEAASLSGACRGQKAEGHTMAARKTDRRIERTRTAITTAMVELMKEQDYEDITVTQIAQRAGVDRKTFYLHYPSKDALLDTMERDRAEQLLGLTHELVKNGELPPSERMTGLLSALMEQDVELYRRVASTPPYSFLVNNEKDILKQVIFSVLTGLSPTADPNLVNLYAEFCAAGMMSTYVSWANSGEKVPREQLIDLLLAVIYEGAEKVGVSVTVSDAAGAAEGAPAGTTEGAPAGTATTAAPLSDASGTAR